MDKLKFALVEDLPGYVKDLDTQALISTEEKELLSYKQKRLQLKRIEHLETQINNMNKEIEILKNSMAQLLSKLSEK